MNGGRISLSPRKVVSNDEQTCHRREGDTHKANNQVWSYLEGWLLEQIRPNWISAGVTLNWSADSAS